MWFHISLQNNAWESGMVKLITTFRHRSDYHPISNHDYILTFYDHKSGRMSASSLVKWPYVKMCRNEYMAHNWRKGRNKITWKVHSIVNKLASTIMWLLYDYIICMAFNIAIQWMKCRNNSVSKNISIFCFFLIKRNCGLSIEQIHKQPI
jgi:hypothetical protein